MRRRQRAGAPKIQARAVASETASAESVTGSKRMDRARPSESNAANATTPAVRGRDKSVNLLAKQRRA
jgi:hypothetical protein